MSPNRPASTPKPPKWAWNCRIRRLKLRAERKAGQFLAKLQLRGGDRKSNRHRTGLKLADMGISEDQSRIWQKMASVSEEDFNQFIEATTSHRKEITAAALLRLAQKQKKNKLAKTKAVTLPQQMPAPYHPELCEMVQELRNHRELLANILRPVCDGGDSRLRSAESRAVGHLLNEMNVTLLEFEKQVRRLKWLEGMNGKADDQ